MVDIQQLSDISCLASWKQWSSSVFISPLARLMACKHDSLNLISLSTVTMQEIAAAVTIRQADNLAGNDSLQSRLRQLQRPRTWYFLRMKITQKVGRYERGVVHYIALK